MRSAGSSISREQRDVVMGEERLGQFPPVVYAPTMVTSEDGQVRLEMAKANDGRTALFVYSAIDRLHHLYRPSADWVLLTIEDLQRAYDAAPYDLLFLDQRLANESPYVVP